MPLHGTRQLVLDTHGVQVWLWSCRIRSFLRPDNAGITAAEALTAPFFTYDQESGFFLDA